MNSSCWRYIQFVSQTIDIFENDDKFYALFIEFFIF